MVPAVAPAAAQVVPLRRTGLLPAAAVTLLALVAGGSAAAVTIAGSEAFDGLVDRFYLFSAVVAVSFGTVGYVVGRRHPGHAVAAIAIGVAWAFGAALLLQRYATLGADRGWPGITWTQWLAAWVWVPAIWAVPTLLALRFPDGTLPSPRWRPVEALAWCGIAVTTIGFALTPYGVLDLPPPVPLPNPVATGFGVGLYRVGLVLAVLAVACSIAAFVLRTVHSRGAQRAQLQWGVAGLVGAVAVVGTSVALGAAPLALVGVTLLPASIAVAVLRHGLWDIGLVLNRSLVYGSLTVAILAVYAVTVGLLGDILGRTVGAPLVATGIVAVGIDPVRRRLQRLANQLVYGDREDPYAALSRLSRELDATVDRSSLLSGVAEAVVRALRLRGAAIVVGDDVLASVGRCDAPSLELPLAVRGEPVGTLRVALREGEELTAADRRLLADLGRQVSAAVRAERLQAELEASRARLIAAREEERRRIRRDLHDGLGPTLAALRLEVERVALELATDPDAASGRLDDIARRLSATVRDVRTVVEGLRPAALDELGLDGAVRELVRGLGRGAVEISVDTSGEFEDLPAAVDLAAYRIVGEAVTNVLRHARATRCTVHLTAGPHEVRIVVEDDGRGIAPDRLGGIGRRSMAERARELGGTCSVTNREEGGARVTAVLPAVVP